jgi:hypothetical protein
VFEAVRALERSAAANDPSAFDDRQPIDSELRALCRELEALRKTVAP